MEKSLNHAPRQSEVDVTVSLFAEIVLDRAIRDFQKKRLQMEIDEALKTRNKQAFLQLTEELKTFS
ncbi:IDEAL domain-containing protein [Priestia megaterium]|nr:IDEAL domain-containing protein [Priestia megaterium]